MYLSFNKFQHLFGNDGCRVGQCQSGDVVAQFFQFITVFYRIQCCGQEFLFGFRVLYVDGGVFIDERQCVLGLVVFCHIGRGDKDYRLVKQAEFRNGAGAGTGDYQIGSRIGLRHVFDEIRHIQVGYGIDMRVVYGFTGCRGDGVPYLVDVYFAGLPDELYVGVLPDDGKAGGQGAVNGACPEAAAQYQDGLYGRVQAEVAYGFFVRNGMSEQVLADGVASHDNLH